MMNFGSQDLVRLGGSEKQFLEKFAPFINQRNYEKLVEEFNGSYYYIERNANPKILFMDLLLKTNELINLIFEFMFKFCNLLSVKVHFTFVDKT